MDKQSESNGSRFFYFGYGSNMLTQRMQSLDKTARRVGLGELKDYKLGFYLKSDRWQGSSCTVLPQPSAIVYGAVWELDVTKMDQLDRQEFVLDGIYEVLTLPVQTTTRQTVTCRMYRIKDLPNTAQLNVTENKPSLTYLKIIVKGAIETKVPGQYLNFLKSFENNGNLIREFEDYFDLMHFAL